MSEATITQSAPTAAPPVINVNVNTDAKKGFFSRWYSGLAVSWGIRIVMMIVGSSMGLWIMPTAITLLQFSGKYKIESASGEDTPLASLSKSIEKGFVRASEKIKPVIVKVQEAPKVIAQEVGDKKTEAELKLEEFRLQRERLHAERDRQAKEERDKRNKEWQEARRIQEEEAKKNAPTAQCPRCHNPLRITSKRAEIRKCLRCGGSFSTRAALALGPPPTTPGFRGLNGSMIGR